MVYYTLFFGFAQLIVDRGGEADRGEEFLGAVFHLDEILGTEDFLETTTAEIGDGEDFLNFEAGFIKDSFDVFGMVVVETVGGDFLVVGDFLVERIDFGAAGDEACHLRQSALVGDFDDGDAARLQNAV